MKRFTVFIVSLFGLALSTMDIAYSEVDQSKILKSAERVVSLWSSGLGRGVDLLYKYEEESPSYFYWTVRRLTLIGTPSYDVQRTDSLVSPYKLIINFSVKYYDNESGPNANGYYDESLEKTYGYRSPEDAMKYTNPEDFIDLNSTYKSEPGDNVMDLSAFFAFQGGKWVLKGGNDLFMLNFFREENKNTDSLIKMLLQVPAK